MWLSSASASMTAPTTVTATPMSNSIAVASSNVPTSGRVKYPKALVKSGAPNSSHHRPVSAASPEEHTSELQSLMRTSYAVFCLQNTNHLDQHLQEYVRARDSPHVTSP